MSTKLSDEQRRAVAEHPGAPLEVEDPETGGKYVIVERGLFEQMRKLLPYDANEPDPRDFYAAFREAVRDQLDTPGMEEYDNYQPPGQAT
jgi:hypothetical protein